MKGKPSRTEIDEVPSITSAISGFDSSGLPFQEWSDLEIRAENWNDPAKKVPVKSQRTTTGDAPVGDEPLCFEDTQIVNLPYNVVVYEWKRVSRIFPDDKLEVYVDRNEYPDLITGNQHLLHSEFMRSFISSIYMLTYLGATTNFTIEHVSPTFTPATKKNPWKPWHHIYSNNTAGLPNKHDPTFNKIGKYVVRLFWMGTWRRVYVDDRVPVDLLNNVLLPSVVQSKSLEISNPKSSRASVKQEKPTIELWPFLLSKALLKIASLTWYEEREILDFDIIHCLTGWLPQQVNTKGLPTSEIWDMCWAYTNHFTWPPETNVKEQESLRHVNQHSRTDHSDHSSHAHRTKHAHHAGHNDHADHGDQHSNVANYSINSKLSVAKDKFESEEQIMKEENYKENLPIVPVDLDNPCHVVARCNDLRNVDDSKRKSNMFPCWAHDFLIHQTRNIPLFESPLTTDLKNWKKLRWLAWAAEKGMISSEELLPKITSYKIVSPFRKIAGHVVHRQPSKITIDTAMIQNLDSHPDIQKETKGKKAKGEKSSKGSKQDSSRRSTREKASVDQKPLPDPSFWVDSDKLSQEINTITIYFKPSEFSTKTEMNDFNPRQHKGKKEGDSESRTFNPLALHKSRNEPVYIFLDSVNPKLVVLNLSQAGYTATLQIQKKAEPSIIIPDKFTECDFCLASLVKRVKRNVTNEAVKDYAQVLRAETTVAKHDRPCAHLVLESYDWKTDKFGNTVASINTYGSKTVTLDLGTGRKIFKMWIKCDTPYAMRILTNAHMVVDSFEKILTAMCQESQLVEHMYSEIASKFEKLVENFGEPQFPSHLKPFYDSYKPQEDLNKSDCAVVHETFFTLLSRLVDENFVKKEPHALNVLLYRWQRTYCPDNIEGYDLCNCYDDEDVEYLKALEKYVTRIQAFFRGIYERSLMGCHNKSNKGHTAIAESLYNIYTLIFSPKNRISTSLNLVRDFILHPNLEKIKGKYTVYHDLENVLTLKEVVNSVKVTEGLWAFICRQQFLIKSGEPLVIKINLFCEFEQFVVRVIDNDTGNEIKRYTNNVAVNEYKPNLKGYTTLCYIWSPSTQVLNYKLIFATKKEVNNSRLTLVPVTPQINLFSGTYIPNINNTICKFLVKLRSERTILSVYFSSCYQDAIIKLKLCDTRGKIFQEIIGKGDVILPAIVLENRGICEIRDCLIKPGASAADKKNSRSASKSQDKKPAVSLQTARPRPSRGPNDRYSSPSIARQESRRKLVGSVSSRTQASICEMRDVKKGFITDEPDVYCIEVSVEDDSWPLNAEEWRNVISVKSGEPLKPSVRGSVNTSISVKGSNISLKKAIKGRSSARASQEFKRADSSFNFRKPYWILHTICNSGDYVDIGKDDRRELEIRNIKLKWGEVDQNRYEKAKRLRKEFLEENIIQNPDVLKEEDSKIRSLMRDDFAARILPQLDLSLHMNKKVEDVQSTRRVKSDAAYEMDQQRELALKEEAEKRCKEYTNKVEILAKDQEKYFRIANVWMNEIRNESRHIMTAAMKQKTACIDQMWEDLKDTKEEEMNANEENKGGKGKKGKKKGKKDKKG